VFCPELRACAPFCAIVGATRELRQNLLDRACRRRVGVNCGQRPSIIPDFGEIRGRPTRLTPAAGMRVGILPLFVNHRILTTPCAANTGWRAFRNGFTSTRNLVGASNLCRMGTNWTRHPSENTMNPDLT